MSKILANNTIVDLPILALMIFIAVFVAVSIAVVLKPKNDPRIEYLSRLPLGEDTNSQTKSKGSGNDGAGGNHE